MSPLILCLVFASAQPADSEKKAQETKPVPNEDVMEPLRRSLATVVHGGPKVKNEGEERELRKLWEDMRAHINILRSHAQRDEMPGPYKDSLRDDEEILRDIGQGMTEPEETLQLCRDVEKDLRIKADYARRTTRKSVERITPGPAERITPDSSERTKPLGLITVIVHTKEGTDEIRGLEVRCISKGLVKYKDRRYHRFDHFSSPTSKRLPPGNYMMWCQRDGAFGAMVEVSPGDDRRDKKVVDLSASVEE